MKPTFLVVFVLSLIVSACGSKNSGGGGGNSNQTPKRVVDPWAGIDRGFRIRETPFRSGCWRSMMALWVRYDGSDVGGEELVCRREVMEGENYEICMALEDDPYFVALESNMVSVFGYWETATDRDEICVRPGGASEAYEEYAAASDEAGGREYRPRCEQFVWHPLMFARFATELSCYSWENSDPRAAVDCARVFEALGGEDFLCQAGLVNGDKALKCSDDWAVVVNGREDDSKTVCRVHLSDGSGRCLAAPKVGASDGELVLDMQQTSWDGYRSGTGERPAVWSGGLGPGLGAPGYSGGSPALLFLGG